jgi:hypothetical protein
MEMTPTPRQTALGMAALGFSLTIALCCAASPAFAQALVTTTNAVDLTPTANGFIAAAVGVLTAVAGLVSKFAISYLSSKTRINDSALEQLMASRLNDVLNLAIGYADTWMKAEVAKRGSQIQAVQFDNFFLAKAVEYAQSQAGGLLSFFGLSQAKLENMIRARMSAFLAVPTANSDVLIPTNALPASPSASAPNIGAAPAGLPA